MKINREMIVRAGLTLLNSDGLEQLTLRRLAEALHVQPATIYWHLTSKEELLDEMATTVLAEGAARYTPRQATDDWKMWARSFGGGLRTTLLRYRDGARMVGGTRLTNTEYLQVTERIGGRLVEAGFSVRAAVVLLNTIYNYAISFTVEEQAVFPTPGERSPQYSMDDRMARLDPALFPLHRKATRILFDGFDRRFDEGLGLILCGAEAQLAEALAKRKT